MNARRKNTLLLAVAVAAVVLAGFVGRQLAAPGATPPGPEPRFTDRFDVENCTWSPTGSNRYFILEPGYQLILRGEETPGEVTELNITVEAGTRVVDGVEARIVVERFTVGGQLVEVSWNYFAICTETNSVFYFGEEVDNYVGGQVANHAGSWLAGVGGARAGLYMAGVVTLGSRYYQEVAPGVALDRAEVMSLDDVVETPAGRFEDVLRTRDTSGIEATLVEDKFYAPGIGLIQDAELQLAILP